MNTNIRTEIVMAGITIDKDMQNFKEKLAKEAKGKYVSSSTCLNPFKHVLCVKY